MKEDQYDIVKGLITKSLSGEITEEETGQLVKWRETSADNEHLFREFTKTYELTQKKSLPPEIEGIDIEAEWQEFLKSTDEEKVKTLTKQLGQSWLRIAATLSLLVVTGVVIYNTFITEEMTVISTASETQSVTLPDGSQVDLNRHTTLRYASDFGEEDREVVLEGEAFFNVTHDSENPFRVSVDETDITVLGTSFNVSGYEKANEIEVVVESGLVGFSSSKGEVVELSEGEKGVFEKDRNVINETQNNDPNFNAWKTRRIVFEETPLPEAINTINAIYSTNVTILADNASNCAVTVTFDQQSLEAVLNVLKSTLNLTYNKTNDTIEVVDAECE